MTDLDGAGSAPDVAVLIVNWNTRDLLRECLSSLAAIRRPGIRTIVIDNASSDGSAEMTAAEFPAVRLLALTENLGFVGGNNRAYGEIDFGARYLLLLNPDAVLRPGALETMIDWMDAHPDAGACGPLTLNPDGTLQPSWSRFPTFRSEVSGRHERRFRSGAQPAALSAEAMRLLAEAAPVDWLSGACLLIRRAVLRDRLQDVLFDPAFQMYSEETDLCCRLAAAGCPTYFLPSAEVIHHYGQSSKQAPIRTIRLLYRSKLLFFRKHYGCRSAALLKLGIGIASGLKCAAYGLLSLPPSPRRTAYTAARMRQQAVLQSLRDA